MMDQLHYEYKRLHSATTVPADDIGPLGIGIGIWRVGLYFLL